MRGLHDELIEYRTHFRWGILVIVTLFLALALRFFHLQIVEGERYEALATVSHVVKDRIQPVRGTLRDRNGEILAVDVEGSDLFMVPQYVKEPERELARLVELKVLDRDEAAAVASQIETAKTTQKRFHRLIAKKGLVSSRCPDDRSVLTFDSASGLLVCPKCGQSYVDQKAVIQTHLHELPGFSLRSRTVRHYPQQPLTAHVIGFVNEVNRAEVDRSSGQLRQGDQIGRTGIERAMDDVLRGKTGEDVYVRSAGGRRIDPRELPPPYNELESSVPTPGRDVLLSIDLDLQRAAVEALAPFVSGAVVALDPQTGQVLAMASAPTFATQSGTGQAKTPDPILAPQMNKAVNPFPPGSTFKMITAIGALSEGLVADETEMFCPGYYEFRGHRFRCFKRAGHGTVDLVRSIAESCDVYYYILGEQLGIDNLVHYARDVFGLGEKTGIEIAENPGLIPSERWYRRHRFGFQPGFALNTSVGQGDVRITPLALARAYAALVNGGRLLRPRLVAAIKDPATGKYEPTEVEVQRVLDIPQDHVETVMAGMFGAVNNEQGTAAATAYPELPFAGKTGTAQARESRPGASPAVASWLLQDHAWFAGYAPASRPSIVVVAFIEHGGFGGAVAAPVVRKVIERFYADNADRFADLWKGLDDDPMMEPIGGTSE